MLKDGGAQSRDTVKLAPSVPRGDGTARLRPLLSMSEIAEKMNHSTAAATGLVDRLENLGYVQRSHAATDRRKVLVKITKKGSALVEKIRQDIVNNLTQIMDLLPPDEQKAWLSIYEKVHSYCLSKQSACSE